MKYITIILVLIASIYYEAHSIGVSLVDISKNKYLKLIDNRIYTQVENQIAIVKSTQVFRNNDSGSVKVKYAFPLPNGSSSISLRFCIDDEWYIAEMSDKKQDSTLPGSGGGGGNEYYNKKFLSDYLGKYPVYYDIPFPIKAESNLTVEITYVQLLEYEWGEVHFNYNAKYLAIQKDQIPTQIFSFKVISEKSIDTLYLMNYSGYQRSTGFNSKGLLILKRDEYANELYHVVYKLNTSQLGIFAFSNYTDTAPDLNARGFLLFIAEPDPSDKTEVIQKRFTLIIDRSGSMSGSKIIQAKNAAKFIMENLNQNDYFNLIDFDDQITPFRNTHVIYNNQNKQDAIKYIDALYADGMTNISGVFNTALNQFPDSSVSSAKEMAGIILFFTDGLPTAGITAETELLKSISTLNTSKNVTIFPFGIGDDVNKSLLTYIAEQNNGLAGFVSADKLEESISDFYLQIRNPVLIHPKIKFIPGIIENIYPEKLQNLYKGHQMVLSGRYREPYDSLRVTLSGTAFGKPVEYNYKLNLSKTSNSKYEFLSKVWAKQKIDHLIKEYYKYYSYSYRAYEIRDSIIDLSLKFRILTEFTSYQGHSDNMPVELILFEAESRNGTIYLNWATASESNNYGFYIERRIKGAEDWDNIGFVKGAGNSNNLLYYSFEDNSLINGFTYQYRLIQIDFDGTAFKENGSDIVTIEYEIDIENGLRQNYPNPFSVSTNIDFDVASDEKIIIDVLNLKGETVKILINKKFNAGQYKCEWDGRDNFYNIVSSGIYLCRMTAGSNIRVITMMFNK